MAEAAGGAVVIPQTALTEAALLGTVIALLADPAGLAAMGERARSLAVIDATDRLVRLIEEIASAAPEREGQIA
jgi:UDP-N-acetylglucosamine--N-acetylmuramyl-(pentapeptide) pyrophosphoryl-undecaprenol N-acetylglucosamine transferase